MYVVAAVVPRFVRFCSGRDVSENLEAALCRLPGVLDTTTGTRQTVQLYGASIW